MNPCLVSPCRAAQGQLLLQLWFLLFLSFFLSVPGHFCWALGSILPSKANPLPLWVLLPAPGELGHHCSQALSEEEANAEGCLVSIQDPFCLHPWAIIWTKLYSQLHGELNAAILHTDSLISEQNLVIKGRSWCVSEVMHHGNTCNKHWPKHRE